MGTPNQPESPGHSEPDERELSRRRFLSRVTLALGGLVGVITALPLVRYFWHPVGRRTVRSSGEPIDVLGVDQLPRSGDPIKVQVVADDVRDAWSVADRMPLGSAWLRKQGDGVSCLSAVCPHLGCAIDYDAGQKQFECPCHRSAFALNGEKIDGPAKRGLDPLPVTVEDGRIKVVWKRFKVDISDREEV